MEPLELNSDSNASSDLESYDSESQNPSDSEREILPETKSRDSPKHSSDSCFSRKTSETKSRETKKILINEVPMRQPELTFYMVRHSTDESSSSSIDGPLS